MKKILLSISIAGFSFANSQVIIGDAIGTAATKTSVLLEFAVGQSKGIIVPYVRTIPSGNALVGGSIILDATTESAARVKYYDGSAWIDLSGQSADLTPSNIMDSQPSLDDAPEAAGSRAIIGDIPNPIPADFPDGVLVLNSTTKTMILPKVGTVVEAGITKVNIPNPSPGMMAYVVNSATGTKKLAVYNGSKWSYWKP